MSTSTAAVIAVIGSLALAPAFALGAEDGPETGQRVLIGNSQQGGERVLILDPHQEGGPRIATRGAQAGGERRLIREGGEGGTRVLIRGAEHGGTRILRSGQAHGSSQGAHAEARSTGSAARLSLTAPPLTPHTDDRSDSSDSE